MSELVRAGKVRWLGYVRSRPGHDSSGGEDSSIVALQTEYSLWTRDVERDILPTAGNWAIGFVPYSPLVAGFLGGKIKGARDLEPGDWRLNMPRFQKRISVAICRSPTALNPWRKRRSVPPPNSLWPGCCRRVRTSSDPRTKRAKIPGENIQAVEVELSPANARRSARTCQQA